MDSTKQSYSITHTHSVFPGTMILFIRLQLILRLRWRDERLIFNSSRLNYILVGRSRSERLWVPDMFITNEKEAQVHKTLSDNALIRIYPNGQVCASRLIVGHPCVTYRIVYKDCQHTALENSFKAFVCEMFP